MDDTALIDKRIAKLTMGQGGEKRDWNISLDVECLHPLSLLNNCKCRLFRILGYFWTRKRPPLLPYWLLWEHYTLGVDECMIRRLLTDE